MRQLTGKPVDEVYRKMLQAQLDDFLLALEMLAIHWNVIDESKYEHRTASQGPYNRDMTMIPFRKADAPFFSSKTLLSSCKKPYATNNQGQKVEKASKAYF